MLKFLLLFLVIVFYAGDQLGINISVAPGISTKNVLLYLIIAGLAISTAVTRSRKFEIRSIIVSFGLLVLYGVISWVVVITLMDYPAYSPIGSLIRLKSSLFDQFLIFLVFFYGVIAKEDAFWLLRMLIWTVLIGNIVIVIDSFDIPNLNLVTVNRDGRFEGFVGSVNTYASFLTLCLPASIALFFNHGGAARILAGLGVFATILALVMTFSRGSYVGVLFGAIVATVYLRRRIDTKNIVGAVIVACVILSVVIVILLAVGQFEFLQERLGLFGGSSHTATSGRSTIWNTALESMMENPLSFITGYGWNAYESSREFYAATHNMYLNYLFNLGAIGLALFMTIFYCVLRKVRASIPQATEDIRPYLIALVFGTCSFLVANFFGDFVGYLDWAYIALMLRLAVDTKLGASSSADIDRME